MAAPRAGAVSKAAKFDAREGQREGPDDDNVAGPVDSRGEALRNKGAVSAVRNGGVCGERKSDTAPLSPPPLRLSRPLTCRQSLNCSAAPSMNTDTAIRGTAWMAA